MTEDPTARTQEAGVPEPKGGDMIRIRATRSFCALVIAAAGLAAAAAPAAASMSLNPPPPSWYTCKPTGSGTICHGTMSFEHFAEFDGTCPQGFNILENAHKDETATRYYDRDGNLTRRVLHDIYPVGNPLNVLYNSQTGQSVPYATDVTETDDLAVPGDFDSATSRFTGNLYTVTLPGGGLLVHDIGTFAFAPDGSILQDRGPKMLFSGQTGKLCAALA
jgi:hypothetical protein